MSFYYVLHKNSIGHLLRTSWEYFRPPLSFSFFTVTAKCWREACSEGCFPFATKNDRSNFFFITTYINDVQYSFENTTYINL